MGIKQFVDTLQQSVIDLLAQYGIQGSTQCKAPGVYVGEAKICSLGLRIRRGYAYHGLSLNVDMDLEPFNRINPCGFAKLPMTQITDFRPGVTIDTVMQDIVLLLQPRLWSNYHERHHSSRSQTKATG